MCINPSIHRDSGAVLICRKCWSCIKNRINDVAGRGMAELAYSNHAVFLTLTFSDANIQAVRNLGHLFWAPWYQRYRQRQLDRETNVRYMRGFEIGPLKYREHFHAILFYTGPNEPKLDFGAEKFTWDEWNFGYTYAEPVNAQNMRYVAKYAAKSENDDEPTFNRQHFGTSHRPMLGHQLFAELARRYVQAGLAPNTREYQVPGDYNLSGAINRYFMTTAGFDNLCRDFISYWEEYHPGRRLPHSEHLEKFLLREAKRLAVDSTEDLIADLKARDGSWSANVVDRAIRAELSRNGAYSIQHLANGQVMAREFDHTSTFVRFQRQLDSEYEIQEARDGLLEFSPEDYLGEDVRLKGTAPPFG